MPDRELVCAGLDIQFWPQVEDAVEEALAHDMGRMTVQDIKEAIEDRKMQLWGIHDGVLRAVAVTQIIDYPQLRCVRYVTLTGRDMESWLDILIETVTDWGAEQGAHATELVGRKGWEKVLSKRGFVSPQVFMTKII